MNHRILALLTYSLLLFVILSSCRQEPTVAPVITQPHPVPSSGSDRYQSDYEAIDKHALNAPAHVEESLPTLAAYLVEPAKNDAEKARAIYRWVTANIAYNDDEYFASNYQHTPSDDILKNRRAVCDGYSGLVKGLGEAAGLEVVNISGYSKGYSYSVHQTDTINHAWNAIKIDGQWQLIDTTWGAGYLDDKQQRFVNQFDDYYFLTPPEQFIYDHFPKDSQWQLLPAPISKSEYDQRVYLRPAFFKKGLRIGSHQHGLIRTNNNRLVVTLQAPADVRLSAQLLQGQNPLDERPSVLRNSTGQYEISANFPRPGEYTLRMYVKRQDEEGPNRWALDYKIITTQGLLVEKIPVSPRQPFVDMDLEVVSHPDRLIKTEQQVKVTIRAPKDVLMSAKIYQGNQELDKTLTFVQRQAGLYEIQAVFPAAGDYLLRLFAKRQNDDVYLEAVDYKVQVSQGLPGQIGFPAIFAPFKDKGVYLYQPLSRYLRAGTTQTFKLAVPGAEQVMVFVGNTRVPLQKQGEVFEGAVKIAAGQVSVYAKFVGETRFAGLLQYVGE